MHKKMTKYAILLSALLFTGCGGGSSSSSDTSAPTFTSSNSVSVNENQTSAITLVATDSSSITYSLSGTDSSFFDIDSSSGVITFKVAPDFEAKNSYSFTAIASDSSNNSSSQEVTINILDVDENGTFIDDIVSGIKYINGSITAFTDINGNFQYIAGSPISFYIGNIKIGEIEQLPSDNKVFIQDLVGVDRNNTSDEKVIKIAKLLQSIDSDETDKILITEETFKKFESISDNIENIDIDTILINNAFSPKSENSVMEHLENTNIKYDTVNPTLTYDKSEEEVVSHSSLYKIKGTASDNVALENVNLEINGTITPIEVTNGEYTASLSLKAGENIYKIIATDKNGNKAEVRGSVYLGHTTAGANAHSGAIKGGKLYTWGRNNYAQTGIGYTSTLSTSTTEYPHPISPKYIAVNDVKFVSLSFNQNFSTAIDENANLWTWGEDKSGQLGRGNLEKDSCSGTEDCRKTIEKVDNLTNIISVATGYNHTIALKNDGTVWTFGKNDKGQLGDGTTTNQSTPVKVLFNESDNVKVVQVAGSSNSSYAIDNLGRVWAWGSNSYSNLGQGSASSTAQTTPILVPFSQEVEIVSIDAGRDHVVALDKSGVVYAWGLNASSQVGFNGINYKGNANAWASPVTSPTIIPSTQTNPATEVFANGNISYILRSDNKVYPWGMFGTTDSSGKTTYANLDEPEDKLPLLTSVRDIAVGILHQVAIQKDGTIFTWGWSFEGSLGGGETTADTWMYNNPIIPVFPE
ncbi:MAG: cadherin domain-containing protein [Arcobacter sp.]|uniref:RCC1 domain-containing protein n=2 Tax=Arcobacter sp. TaxID=1872629 RepID=UPI003D09F58B